MVTINLRDDNIVDNVKAIQELQRRGWPDEIIQGLYDELSIKSLLEKAQTEEQRQAILTAGRLSDKILFHTRVRENGTKMMQPWEDA